MCSKYFVFLALIDYISEEGKLKCAAMKACFTLCLRQTLSERLSENDVTRRLDAALDLIEALVRYCRRMNREDKEIVETYAKFLSDMQMALLCEVLT